MKIYRADRPDNQTSVTVDGFPLLLGPSLEIRSHSPTEFEWGYGGSGPAQLALAILLDFFEDAKLAEELYQQFKWQFIAPAAEDGFEITGDQIEGWLEADKTIAPAALERWYAIKRSTQGMLAKY